MFYRVIFICVLFLSNSLLANVLENIKSFEASFVQTIINSSNKKIEYKGVLYIKEPSKILWKYQEPIIKNVFVINNFAIVDEPELEQAIFTSLDSEINLLKLIKTAKKVDKTKYITKINNVDYTLYVLKDKIAKIEYKDELENRVTILFGNVKQNIEISDEIFKFSPPEHYDIIRK